MSDDPHITGSSTRSPGPGSSLVGGDAEVEVSRRPPVPILEPRDSSDVSGDGPRTVVNPERRGRSSDRLVESENSVLRRLFPTDSELRSGLPRDATGIRLDHFEIVERIGSGGMSAVFKARDTRLDRVVALKVLTPEQSRDSEAVQRFLNEARAAARLNHPNIVKSFHVGVTDGIHFIAYEYVDGENLRDHVRRHGRPDVRDAVNVTIQIALALQHAESLGIVHRDIKPSNIVLNEKRQAKLIDLGLARQPSEPGDELTIAGTTLGTFDYVSPEQARDPRSVDVRSDVYSLGCTLYYVLTGEPPYPEGTVLQKLLDHQAKQPPNPTALNPRVPPSLASLCQRMMASNPSRRPRNAEALLRELAVVASQLGLQAAQPEGLVWGVPERRSTFWEKHLGWMTTVVLLLGIVFVLDRFPASEPTTRPNSPPEWTGSDTTTLPGVGPADPAETPSPEPDRGEADTESTTTAERGPSGSGGETEAPGTGSEPSEPPGELAITPPDRSTDREPGSRDPEGSAAETDDPAAGPDFSIVSKEGEPLRGYASLAAAVAAAADGDVVELAYDGTKDERPIRVSGKSITIRAATGYTPSLRFVHDAVPTEEPIVRMITLSGAAVDLVNLDVTFVVDESVVLSSERRWSLFALYGNDRVEVRNTRITVENPSARVAAVVDVLEPDVRPGPGGVKMMKPGGETTRTEMRFVDSVVRGDVDAVVVGRTQPVRLEFDNSLLSVGQSAVFVTGSSRPAGESDVVDVRATHVTAFVGNGLVRFESGEFPRYLPVVEFSSRNNVFATRTDVALVNAHGSTDLQDFRELLRWTGDTNFYDGFRLYWTTPPSQSLSTVRDLDLEGWKRLWNSTGTYTTVAWVTEPNASAYASYIPVDFALDPEAPSNPAVSGATDGTDAGANLTSLGPTRR